MNVLAEIRTQGALCLSAEGAVGQVSFKWKQFIYRKLLDPECLVPFSRDSRELFFSLLAPKLLI